MQHFYLFLQIYIAIVYSSNVKSNDRILEFKVQFVCKNTFSLVMCNNDFTTVSIIMAFL